MNFKALLKSKTFWAGLASIVTGIGMVAQGDMQTGMQTVLTGIMVIFLRDTMAKGGK